MDKFFDIFPNLPRNSNVPRNDIHGLDVCEVYYNNDRKAGFCNLDKADRDADIHNAASDPDHAYYPLYMDFGQERVLIDAHDPDGGFSGLFGDTRDFHHYGLIQPQATTLPPKTIKPILQPEFFSFYLSPVNQRFFDWSIITVNHLNVHHRN